MPCSLNLSNIHTSDVYPLGDNFTGVSAGGEVISFNNAYMEKNGRPFFAISGEFHYSRMDNARWEDELIKIRMGGVNVVSTYVFWNHHEEKEGCFDFTGQRDLRRFITLCAKHGLYVILRVGPFAHGEARNGGLPDWLYGKPFEVRSTSEAFLGLVRRLYSCISEQVQGLLWKDGGPVIGIQLDNEYMHSSAPWEMTTGISNEWVSPGTDGEAYLLALRQIALECGLIPAFFTGTAWGGAAYSDKILPLWGGYAYRPWLFYSHQGEHPATEEYVYEDYHRNGAVWADDFAPAYAPETRPYACCEMGAGMMCCYSYRFVYPCRSVDALANIKLGSGCNFIGYYMFHGGTNPIGRLGTYMNESQVSKISYDYQAALGEYGQIRESYSRLKVLHYFLQSFGDRLAPMQTVLPDGASAIDPRDTQTLRFAVRTDGESGFLFVNNFQDHLVLPDRVEEEVVLKTRKETCRFAFGIASEENAVLPFHFDMDGILLRQAHAQPVLRTVIGGRVQYVFMVPDGMDGAFCFEETAQVTGGKPFFTVCKGQVQVDVLVLTRAQADQLFLLRDGSLVLSQAALLEDEHGTLRLESTEARNTLFCFPPERLRGTALRLPDEGPFGVYCAETCAKQISVRWEPCAPFRWTLQLPEDTLDGLKDARLQIDYQGDIGMLFLNDCMISDNFCNGATWEIGLLEQKGRLPGTMVLKITPLRKDAKVNVESAMAARKEEVRTTVGELLQVRVQPVYEIKL